MIELHLSVRNYPGPGRGSEVNKADREPALSKLPLQGRNTDGKTATKLQGISATGKGKGRK